MIPEGKSQMQDGMVSEENDTHIANARDSLWLHKITITTIFCE